MTGWPPHCTCSRHIAFLKSAWNVKTSWKVIEIYRKTKFRQLNHLNYTNYFAISFISVPWSSWFLIFKYFHFQLPVVREFLILIFFFPIFSSFLALFSIMVQCCGYGCNNRSGDPELKARGVTFHKFPNRPNPKDQERRSNWIKAVSRDQWEVSPESKLCSDHFVESDFIESPDHRWLKNTAVPTVFKEISKKTLIL